YSQIMISQGSFNEFGDGQASLGDNIGIVDFDNTFTYSGLETDAIKDLVSEHRPIWAKFRIDLGDDDGIVTGVDDSTPLQLKLLRNYPNPFNPSTVISFELPSSSHVRLNVYNLSGQLVDTLMDEAVNAGLHEVVWESEGVASGVYQCVVESGSLRYSTKMTLVR
ncbi:T9SS type A sorting domain-containing protein, partial [Candidatus Latescibacterota bacterium]